MTKIYFICKYKMLHVVFMVFMFSASRQTSINFPPSFAFMCRMQLQNSLARALKFLNFPKNSLCETNVMQNSCFEG
jgi:hypothetical protein